MLFIPQAMIDEAFMRSLGLIVVSGACFALGARWLRLPMLVGFLVAGLFLGPATGLVEVSEALHMITEMGIVLLLFLVGLELHFERIRDVGRQALLAGAGQVVMTALVSFGLCRWLGYEARTAFLLAMALTFSSTVVAVKLLADQKETGRLYGRLAVGILLVQDLVVVLLLTFVVAVSGGEPLDAGEMAWKGAKAFAMIGVLMIGVLLLARFVLPRPFAWAARSPDTLFIWSLCWCFLIVLGSHLLHLSHEIGAFLAGVSLAQAPFSHDLHRRVRPMMNLFLAVFFVTLGIGMELGNLPDLWVSALGLSLFVLLFKPVIVAWFAARLGYGERTAVYCGITLGQISEFSFILMALCARGGLVSGSVVALVGLVGLISISISSCAIVGRRLVFEWLRGAGWTGFLNPGGIEDAETADEGLKNHVIVVGMNTLGRQLVQWLHEEGETVLAVDTDPEKISQLPCRSFHGDVQSFAALEDIGLPEAKLLVSCLQIEDTNNLLAYRCRCCGVPCSIHAIDLSMIDNLLDMEPTYLMLPKVDGIKLQNRKLKEMGLLP